MTGGPTSKAEAMRNSDPPPNHELPLRVRRFLFWFCGEGGEKDSLEKTGSLNVHDSIHRRCAKTNNPLLGLIAVSLIR